MTILKPLLAPKNFFADRRGVAAAEFAIGAPMMIFAAVIMADLGLAMHERMNLDQATRAGAEFVMGNVSSTTELEKLVTAAATGDFSENAGDVTNADRPTVNVVNWCECPDAPGTNVSCSGSLCPNDRPPSNYYQIAASKTYNAIFLPDFALNTQIRVQAR